ncbi:hypothetical protein DZC18_001830 [Clostridium beijerinckii]|nr:hypothetical protein [Clostridium beijerinckii]
MAWQDKTSLTVIGNSALKLSSLCETYEILLESKLIQPLSGFRRPNISFTSVLLQLPFSPSIDR